MKKCICFIAALCALASCAREEETLYKERRDDGKEIHFVQKALTKEFAQGLSEGEVLVDIARPGKTGTYAVWLNLAGEDKAHFSAPVKVDLRDGAFNAPVAVKVDLSALLVGGEYNASLYIFDREAPLGDDAAWDTQFVDKVDIKVSFALEWEEYNYTKENGEVARQTATYRYNAFYNGFESGLEVDKAVGANVFRVNDWASGVSFRFILNEDNTCVVPAQSIGYFNSYYNEYVRVSDVAVYTKDSKYYTSYPCTYDGEGKFTFNLVYFVSAGIYALGEETLTFDGEADSTATMKIVFEGGGKTETGFSAPQFTFVPGEFTKQYKVAFVKGDITSEKKRQRGVRDSLIADLAVGVITPRTFYEENTDLWNIPQGCYTAVALPYNLDGVPEKKLCMLRFTSDPDSVLVPKVTQFAWYCPEDNPLYDPYETLLWDLRCERATRIKYLCVRADVVDLILDYYDLSLAQYVDKHGGEIDTTYVKMANSEEGLSTSFNGMASGCEYTLCVLAYNAYGDTVLVRNTARTLGRDCSEFDEASLEDFIGVFKATSVVTNSASSSKKTEEYRVDIYKQGTSSLAIKGLSNVRDFSPEVTGYYDAQNHCILIEPQALGTYRRNNTVKLGFTDGLSTWWGGSVNMALGFIGGKLQLLSGPESTNQVTGYRFLIFDSEGAYTGDQVAYKTYSSLTLERIIL